MNGKYYKMMVIEGCNNKAREVLFPDAEWVLYSYDTPVAVLRVNGEVRRLWDGHSATTMRHINRWLEGHAIPAISKAKWDKMPVEAT